MSLTPSKEYLRKRLAIMAIEGAKIENLGRMYVTCAFKFDSPANLEPHNVIAAHECLAFGMKFHCHLQPGIEKGCECIGFRYAMLYISNNE